MNGVVASLADRFDIAADALHRIASSDQKAGEQGKKDYASTRHIYHLSRDLVQNGPARFEGGGEGMRAGPMLLSSAAGGRGSLLEWETRVASDKFRKKIAAMK